MKKSKIPPDLQNRLCYGFFDTTFKMFRYNIYTTKNLRKNWAALPLIFLKIGAGSWALFSAYQRLFVTTIDVQLGSQRFELLSKPTFIDLRCPRRLKLWGATPEPMIDLDNRYRLMRHEKPISPEGCTMEKFEEFEKVTPEEHLIKSSYNNNCQSDK